MTGSRSRKDASKRRRLIQFAAVVAALAMVLLSVFAIPAVSAAADERSDAVARRNESQTKIDSLQNEVEGIDEDLAGLFREMEQTKLDVAQAQIDLVDAEADLAAAERHLTTIRAELVEAQDELDSLRTAVSVSRGQENTLTQAVGDMARDLYRGNNVSPLQVVMSSDGTGEISSRAAAASALGRVQSRAMDEVRSTLVVQENQKERQTAVAERITELEAEAEVAVGVAEDARAQVEDRVVSLETLLITQQEAESAWMARKGEAEKQLASHAQAVADWNAEIARIDRENAAKQTIIPNNPAPSTPNAGSGGGGSSGATQPSSPSAPAPSGGALFANPFSFYAPVSSPYGWRIHPIFGTALLHDGTDFAAGCGTAQLATRAGQISSTGWYGGLGNQVTINHGLVNGSSMVTRHGHLQTIAVSPGQYVNQGQVIGYTGSTGNSTGCHLHLSLFINGSSTNILAYM